MKAAGRWALVAVAVGVVAVGCDSGVRFPGKKPSAPSVEAPVDVPNEECAEAREGASGLPGLDQLKALYAKAKAAGENVPDDVMTWAKADVKKIGTWRYKVVTLPDGADEHLQKKLQELGDERWDCFWVESTPEGKRFYLKKAGRSYVKMAVQASSFIPGGEEGE